MQKVELSQKRAVAKKSRGKGKSIKVVSMSVAMKKKNTTRDIPPTSEVKSEQRDKKLRILLYYYVLQSC